MSWSDGLAEEIRELFEEPTILALLREEGRVRDHKASKRRISWWPRPVARSRSELEKIKRRRHRLLRQAYKPAWSPPAPSPRPDLEAKRARQRAVIALSRTGQSVIE